MIRRRRRARSVVSDSGELRPGHWGAKSPRRVAGEVAGTVRRREEREDEGENDLKEGGRVCSVPIKYLISKVQSFVFLPVARIRLRHGVCRSSLSRSPYSLLRFFFLDQVPGQI